MAVEYDDQLADFLVTNHISLQYVMCMCHWQNNSKFSSKNSSYIHYKRSTPEYHLSTSYINNHTYSIIKYDWLLPTDYISIGSISQVSLTAEHMAAVKQ